MSDGRCLATRGRRSSDGDSGRAVRLTARRARAIAGGGLGSWIAVVLLAGACAEAGSGDGVVRARTGRDSAPPPPSAGGSHEVGLADAVHSRINDYRESQGLDELDLDEDLSRIAGEHSRRMANGDVQLGHAGFGDRARAVRRETAYSSLAENVGYNLGYADPAENAVEGWLRSPEHLANVMGDYELTGIGVAANARGEYYFTQIFVKPPD